MHGRDVDTPIGDVSHDVGHNLPTSLVAPAEIVEDGGANDNFGSY